MSHKEEMIIAKLKDGKEHIYLIEPFLDDPVLLSALDRLKSHDHCSLVVYNTQQAFDTVIKTGRNSRNSRGISTSTLSILSQRQRRDGACIP